MWFSQQKKFVENGSGQFWRNIAIELKMHRMDIFLVKDDVKIANNLKLSEAKI